MYYYIQTHTYICICMYAYGYVRRQTLNQQVMLYVKNILFVHVSQNGGIFTVHHHTLSWASHWCDKWSRISPV